MSQEEILIKLGIDSSGVSRGMAGVFSQAQRAGEQMGGLLQSGIMSKIGARAGLYGMAATAIGTLLSAAKDLWGDKIQHALGIDKLKELMRAGTSEKEAGQRNADIEQQGRELDAKVRERRKEEKEAAEELRHTQNEGVSPMVAAHARMAELAKQLRDFHGSTLDKLKLQNKLEQERNNLARELKEFREKGEEEGRKAFEKAKEAAKDAKQKAYDELVAKTQLAKIEREIADTQRHQKQQSDAARYEPFMPTLQELAASGSWMRNLGGATFGGGFFARGPFAQQAAEILRLQQAAHDQFMGIIPGGAAGARGTIDNANKLYDRLAKAGVVPDRAEKVAEAQMEMAEHIADLVNKRAEILVDPKLAP